MPRRKKSKEADAGGTAPKTKTPSIIRRIITGDVVPLISNAVCDNLLLEGHAELAEDYANDIDYPLDRNHRLPRITQFKRVTDTDIKDAWQLETSYIDFLKNRIFDLAEKRGVPQDTLDEVEEEFDDISFSEFCRRLGYPSFENTEADPLLILASFPIPIYLTTGYHNFIEAALRRAGKNPRTEICRWNHKLNDPLRPIPSAFTDGYQPSDAEPLVYHLLGLDEYRESLVLTEDNYLEFLVAISEHRGKDTDPIDGRVRAAIAVSSLMMLGYDLHSWEFRVLYWGLLQHRTRDAESISLQLEPGNAEKEFLERYLTAAKFEVYWGDIETYATDLRQAALGS